MGNRDHAGLAENVIEVESFEFLVREGLPAPCLQVVPESRFLAEAERILLSDDVTLLALFVVENGPLVRQFPTEPDFLLDLLLAVERVVLGSEVDYLYASGDVCSSGCEWAT